MSEALAGHSPDIWDDDLDSIEALMSEGPSECGTNHGRKATQRLPTTSPDKDGEDWSDARRSLDSEMLGTIQRIAQGGTVVVDAKNWGHFHGLVTHLKTGGQATLTDEQVAGLDSAKVRAVVLDRLGMTEAEMTVLGRPGGMAGSTKRALQDRLDDRLLEVQESGAVMNDLARALGWQIRASQGECQRLKRSLARARKRRSLRAGD
jgi:hypothetical protein